MHNTIPSLHRKIAVDDIFLTATVKKVWPTWRSEIQRHLGPEPDETKIFDLGDHLSAIFATTRTAGRQQGELSGGGVAWEALVCWYLNLCMVGTRCVAFKRMSLVPKAVKDAITINYGNFACNTESDITIVVFPDLPDYYADVHNLNVTVDGTLHQYLKDYKLQKKVHEFLVKRDFVELEIGIVQCKTNWNDNAQIPMLWDMIYSANGFRGRNITIGQEGFNLHDTRNFTYAFVTVPTNPLSQYMDGSVKIKRVTNMSGGNYWGHPSRANVARSLKEIFVNNYQGGTEDSFRTNIRQALPDILAKGGGLDYFNL
jgi:hypothetical protein